MAHRALPMFCIRCNHPMTARGRSHGATYKNIDDYEQKTGVAASGRVCTKCQPEFEREYRQQIAARQERVNHEHATE